MLPLHSKLRGTLYSSLEDGVVAAARMTVLPHLIRILFNKQVVGTLRACAMHIGENDFVLPYPDNHLSHQCACLHGFILTRVYSLTIHLVGYLHLFVS